MKEYKKIANFMKSSSAHVKFTSNIYRLRKKINIWLYGIPLSYKKNMARASFSDQYKQVILLDET